MALSGIDVIRVGGGEVGVGVGGGEEIGIKHACDSVCVPTVIEQSAFVLVVGQILVFCPPVRLM